MNTKLVFTIDVEDWFHSENIAPHIGARNVSHSSMYIMDMLLEYLAAEEIRGTFFFLGVIAKDYPELVKKVGGAGHEVASHGWDHKLINKMNASELETDLKKTSTILEDLVGEKIVGYRSPCFSQSEYLLSTLIELGYIYTSMGIESSFHDRYRNNLLEESALRDFALPVAKFYKYRIPATGGGWFRAFPQVLQKLLIHRANTDPNVFYCHPIDFDSNLPSMGYVPLTKRLRQKINISQSFQKLGKFEFAKFTLRDHFTAEKLNGSLTHQMANS